MRSGRPSKSSPRNRQRVMLGLHIVKKSLKLSDRYYVYAWRGGPCIHRQDGAYPTFTPELMKKRDLAINPAAKFVPAYSFDALMDRYEAATEFTSLAPSTQKEYKRLMVKLSAEFGSLPTQSFQLRELRGDILAYRDRYAETPRTADALVTMLATILSWAVNRGEITVNPATNVKKLHSVNRADLIWEDTHWNQIKKAELPSHVYQVLEFLSLVGTRLGDALSMTWKAVTESCIEYSPSKGKRHDARAVVPLYGTLAAWLKNNRPADAKDDDHILLNSRGLPWTEDGFESSYRKKRPESFDRTLHDLKGTFVTMLLMAGATDTEAAMAVGWTNKRIEDIRKRYVDEKKVLRNLKARLEGMAV